jgi:cysteine synthase A
VTLKANADITELIGGTPLVRLNRLTKPGSATIYAKVESFNPGGSIKDRICLNMINEAERLGKLKPGGTIVEPTSGNTGIGLALVAAVRGAQLVLTAAWEGMKGSIKEAESIVAQNPSYYMPDQFSNPANPAMHRKTTGPEIVEALDGRVDAFVAAVGTGGTITGCGEVIRERNPAAKIIAVEPAGSPVLSGGDPGPHKIQGIGAGFVPKVLNRTLLDRVVTVTDDEAYQTAKLLAKKEGLLVGISAGANVFAAQKIAEELGPGKNVVTILCDTGERYISIEKYFNI